MSMLALITSHCKFNAPLFYTAELAQSHTSLICLEEKTKTYRYSC